MTDFFLTFSKFLGLPAFHSAHGIEVDRIIVLTHILMFVLFVGWGSFFLYTLFRFRKGRNPKADPTGVKGHTSSYLEIGVALFEVVLLIGFSIPLWSQRVNAFPPREEAVVVRVVAEQFAWNAHYAGPDGQFGRTAAQFVDTQTNPLGLDREDPAGKDDLVTINQVHLPVGRNVIVELSSKDVIHSFGVPQLRVKQDAIPGMSIPLWFTPTEEGSFEIVCSQLCGLGHYRMRGVVNVHSQEQFDTVLGELSAQQSSTSSEGGGDGFWQ